MLSRGNKKELQVLEILEFENVLLHICSVGEDGPVYSKRYNLSYCRGGI